MATSASPAGREEVSRSDQRQSPRRVVSERIAIELQSGHKAWIRDVGEGGLSISASAPLELGTSTEIRFELPEAESVIDAFGVVTWSDKSGRSGVRFTQVEPASTVALRKWLSAGAPTPLPQSDPTYDNDLAAKVACLRQVADLQGIISSERLETDAALDLIVGRMADLTRATGAAIALHDGENVVCRASFGNAPDVGVKLSSSSLSGECLRSGAVVMLEDSENDSRVNPEVCRQLNFRSLLVMPVTAGTEAIGIAEVLSPNLRNFDGGDVLVMSFLNDLIVSLAGPRQKIEERDRAEIIRLQVLEPQEDIDVQSAAQEICADVTFASPVAVVAPEVAPVLRMPAILPDKKSIRVLKPATLLIPMRGISLYVIAAVLAIALLLLGYSYYRQNRASGKSVNTPSLASSSSNATSTPPVAPSALPNAASASAVNSRTDEKLRSARHLSVPPATRSAEPETTELSVIQGHTVNVKPASEPADPEPLAITTLPPARSSTLPASIVDAKPADPQLGLAQSQGVIPGKLIKRVLPQYPDMARRAGVSGAVVISGIIGTDGALHSLKAVSGSPLLRDAAIEAARQWRYSPYLLGGKAVEAETHITVSFHQ